jgi:hypothetical protein
VFRTIHLRRPIAALLAVLPACAQYLQQGAKLVGSDAAGAAMQGTSLALSADGNTAILGGASDAGGIGAAWVFVRANGVWSQQGFKLVGSNNSGPSAQGQAVALSADGNTAIIGGFNDSGGIGAVWIFARTGNRWSQVGEKLVGSGGVAPLQSQGYSVALSADGNTALVGAPGDNITGAAWVFVRGNTGAWTQQGFKLVGNPWLGATAQGRSVALSSDGNTAIIGADHDTFDTGAAWVFTRSISSSGQATWAQQAKLVGSGSSVSRQGIAVALSADGNTAMVGGFFDSSGVGAVWFFSRSGSTWNQQGGKFVGSGAVGSAQQGHSVALSADGNTAVEGGPNESSGTGTGGAWIFRRDLNGVWSQQGAKLSGTGYQNANLGSGNFLGPAQGFVVSLSANGSTLLLGGINDNNQAGAAWVFALPRLSLTTPASAVTATPFNFLVQAFDASNAPLSSYSGTVRFSSTDAAAVVPPDSQLTSGVGNFSATLNTIGSRTLTAFDTSNPGITGTSPPIAVAAPLPPVPVSAFPSGGNASSQTFTFTFTDPRGYQDLSVINILVNDFLDGRHACYLAYAVGSSTLYLVDDAGDAGGPFAGSLFLGKAATIQNSQCQVKLVSATGLGNGFMLSLSITWSNSFAGDKIIYVASRDVVQNNSGWQALGVWRAPGATSTTTTSVVSMNPNQSSGLGPTQYTFTFSDSNGFQDLGIENILINSSLDGTHACYLAISPADSTLFLVNDTGSSLSPSKALDQPGGTSNSQCAVSWQSTALNGNGNQLAITLTLTFSSTFTGNRVFYLAARDINETNNTGWHAMATQAVQ